MNQEPRTFLKIPKVPIVKPVETMATILGDNCVVL